MKTITLEDDVFADLDKLTTSLFSHSDVIRKLLTPRNHDLQSSSAILAVRTEETDRLTECVQSLDYQMMKSAISKYLYLLGWLSKTYPNEFKRVESYKRGNRVYFAKSQAEVVEGGNGAIHAKQIPHSNIWALATLDNATKRKILTHLLPLFGFKQNAISRAISTIADSGGHESKVNKYISV